MIGTGFFPTVKGNSGSRVAIAPEYAWKPFVPLVLALVVALATATAGFAADQRRIVTTDNQDYYGFDLRSEQDVSLDQCKSVCLSDSQCRAFTYNTRARWCFLKSDFGKSTRFEGAVAGKVVTVSGDPDLGAPPALSFLPAGFDHEAADLRNRLAEPDDGTGLFRLAAAARRQISEGNYQHAVLNLRTALGYESDRVSLWLDLARASDLQLRASGDTNYDLQRLATAAALNAYDLSRTAAGHTH